MRLVAFIAFLLVLPASAAESFRLYYSSNRQGEIDPCGCAVNQIGGLHRMRKFLTSEGRKDALLGDAGDAFFAAPTINASRRDIDVLRAMVIADSYKKLGVDAFTPGERDFAGGLATLRELEKRSGAVFLAANLDGADGKPLFEKWRLFTKGGRKVGVVGIVDETFLSSVDGVRGRPAEEALRTALAALKEQKPDFVIVLSHLGLPRDKEIAAKVEGIDVIVGSHSLDALTNPVVVGKTRIVQPLPQGEQLGIFDFTGTDVAHRLVDLGKSLDEKNDVFKLMEGYKKQVRELALRDSAGAAAASVGKAFVANPFQCRDCHRAQYDFWKKTHHASAYLVLHSKNQHFDPECIGCHSLGFESAEGFMKVAKPLTLSPEPKMKKGTAFVEQMMGRVFENKQTPVDSRVEPERYAKLKERYHAEMDKLHESKKLKRVYLGVQCEHCHGNRNGHPSPEVPTVKRVQETSCKTCHHPPHDEKFVFAEKVKKVACPLSGSTEAN